MRVAAWRVEPKRTRYTLVRARLLLRKWLSRRVTLQFQSVEVIKAGVREWEKWLLEPTAGALAMSSWSNLCRFVGNMYLLLNDIYQCRCNSTENDTEPGYTMNYDVTTVKDSSNLCLKLFTIYKFTRCYLLCITFNLDYFSDF